jgi:transposase
MDEMLFGVCCGLDVHMNSITACLRMVRPNGGVERVIREFSGTTKSISSLGEWLVATKCPVVAVESTGIYWRPVYRDLSSRSIEVRLVNPQAAKALRGKKTDKLDAKRLAQLLAFDQIPPSFVPPPQIAALRYIARERVKTVQARVTQWNRVSKLLNETGIKLDSVAAKLNCKSGRLIVEALQAGERDPEKLADLACGVLRRKLPELQEALTAPCDDLHLHLLGLHLNQISVLDAAVASHDAMLDEACEALRTSVELLCTIPGIKDQAAKDILAEIGTDMSQFGTASRLASWAGLCPGNNESAGKRRSGRTRRGNRYLRRILVQCAWTCRASDSWVGHRFRQLSHRKGKKKAVVAIAHKLLVIVYHVLSSGQPYEDSRYGDRYHEDGERLAQAKIRDLERLGFKVTIERTANVA